MNKICTRFPCNNEKYAWKTGATAHTAAFVHVSFESNRIVAGGSHSRDSENKMNGYQNPARRSTGIPAFVFDDECAEGGIAGAGFRLLYGFARERTRN